MNRLGLWKPLLARAAAGLCLVATATTPGRAAEPTGIWKFVALAFGDEDFAIVDIHRADGEAKGVVIDGRKGLLDKAKIDDLKLSDDHASFVLKGPAMVLSFEGGLVKEGRFAGQLVGVMQVQNSVYPARMERTHDERLGQVRPGILGQDYISIRNEKDSKVRVQKLREMAAKHDGAPVAQVFYNDILGSAQDAELPAADVQALVEAARRDARAFGSKWADEVSSRLLAALAPQKAYAETALKLGTDLDKSLPADASVETRFSIANHVAAAARNAGKPDVAAEAESRAARYDAQLDEEYHSKVPPFKPTPYEGRKASGAGRPVVMELFTGAQCPPCVAADVAFDGLLKTYKPADFIGLQYHLHIPGPDPLTNNDSIARQKYYASDVRGTPSTFFNGRSEAGGGGGMGASEGKYAEYRELIDKLLEEKPVVDLSASAKRTGDDVAILAEAKTLGEKKPDSSLKLRLALTEESIRYVGSNRLRFHHHVVRALPGGAEGASFADGKGKVEIKLNLSDLRKQLEGYLSEAAQRRPFPLALPAIGLKDLSVVAFVQDDLDKAILGAVSIPVTSATP